MNNLATRPPRVLLAVNRALYPTIFSERDAERLKSVARVLNDPPEEAGADFLKRHLGEADIVITSWDTAPLDEAVLDGAGRLRLLCHAAGSVRPVTSRALWERGVRVASAASAISHGVAEYCLGLALMASKRVFWLSAGARRGEWTESASCFGGLFELYQQPVGVIGAGHIGRQLLKLLSHFDCERWIYDPFCPESQAAELGARKAGDLEELFARCRVVSLNAPSNEGTREMLRGRHFAQLRPGSVFINTAGSIQIHEEEFVAELRKGRFVACIDRCATEPCALDHPYRMLPNVILTPHIAGVAAENRLRIGTYVVEEVEAFAMGSPPVREITEEQLEKMA